MRRVGIAVVFVAMLGAAALIGLGLVEAHGGPLDEVGNAFAGPVQAGHPFTANYELRNNGDRSIEVTSVTLGRHTPGLRLLGARVQTSGTHFGGAWAGFPLARTTSVPAGSFVLGQHGYAALQVGLQADKIGGYRLMGVDVRYRVPYIGRLGRHYKRTLTTETAVCAQLRPVRARTPLCDAPNIG